MKLPQFTLRDLFWLVVVVGMGCGLLKYAVFDVIYYGVWLIIAFALPLSAAIAFGAAEPRRSILLSFFAGAWARYMLRAGYPVEVQFGISLLVLAYPDQDEHAWYPDDGKVAIMAQLLIAVATGLLCAFVTREIRRSADSR